MKGRRLKGQINGIEKGSNYYGARESRAAFAVHASPFGSTDSELRDTYIYGSFYEYEWILEKNLLDDHHLTELWGYSLNHLLFKGIEEKESDWVFTRSFTSLLVALILGRDLADDFLSKGDIEHCQTKLLAYVKAEKDVRGYCLVRGGRIVWPMYQMPQLNL